MADNISVNITADATQLRAQLALAQQDLRIYGAAVRAAAADIKQSGTATAEQVVALDKAAAGYNGARAAVTSLRASLGEGGAAARTAAQGLEQFSESAGHAAHGTAGITREIIVLGHEMLQGRFSRIPGSMMVLAERSGGVLTAITSMSAGMLGAVGGVVALGGALALLTYRAIEADHALRAVYNAALLQGRGAAATEADAKRWAETMQQTGAVGTSASRTMANAIAVIPGLSDSARAKLAELAPALSQVLHAGDANETVKSLDQIFRSTSSLRAFTDENRLLTVGQQNAFDAAVRAKDAYAAQAIALDALKARIGVPYADYLKQVAEVEAANRRLVVSYGNPRPADVKVAMQPLVRMPQTGTLAESEETQHANQIEQEYLGILRERQKLQDDMVVLQQRLGAATTDQERAEAQAAIETNQARQAMLKNPGDEGWAAKVAQQAQEAGDAAVATAAAAHAKRQAIVEAGMQAEMLVYENAAKDMTRTEAERNAMSARAIQLRMALVKEDAGAGEKVANQALQTKLATLSAEQAANHDNYAAVLLLEDQKLALLKAAGADYSKQYQEELKRREEMQRQHNAQLQMLALEHIGKLIQIDQQELGERRALLDAEVSDHQITKQAELQELLDFSARQYAIELKSLDDLLATLTQGTAEYQKATDQRTLLEQEHARAVAALRAQLAQADRADQQRTLQQHQSMFSGVASAAQSSIAGIITGRTTWLQAEQRIAGQVLDSAVSLTSSIVERWAAAELAKSFATETGVAARVAAEQAEGASGWGAILAHWLGLEAAKTSATAAGAATRATADAGGGFVGAVGQMLASWLGLESAKTGASVAGATARTAAMTTADVTAGVSAALLARSEIAGDAAIAAAAAFASTAAIPVVGPAAAPAAASLAYGTVMAFQAAVPAFAVGTDYVPRDMLAIVHQGEAIIPAAQNTGNMVTGNGRGGNVVHYAPVFHGADTPGMRALVQRNADDFVATFLNMARNGNLRLPGR